jgi:hypothetical protein
MRLAICLSGQPRTWRYTHESLFKFFDGHELDIFIHTWDDVEASELEAIRSAYSPRVIVQGARPLFLDEKRAMAARFPESPPLSIFDMFHSVAASVALALEASKSPQPDYDLICRTRFDTIYDGRWRGEPPPKGAIAVQTGEFEPPGGCNDHEPLCRCFSLAARRDGKLAAALLSAGNRASGLSAQHVRPEHSSRTFRADAFARLSDWPALLGG